MTRPLKVSVVPPVPTLERDCLFESRNLSKPESAHRFNIHWMDYMHALSDICKQEGIKLHTADLLAPEKAELVIIMRWLRRPDEVMKLKKANRANKTILMQVETNVGAAFLMNARNLRGIDAVMSYSKHQIPGMKTCFFPPRTYYRNRIQFGANFDARKLACFVATHYRGRLRFGIGLFLRGWKLTFSEWLDYVVCPGQLGSYRLSLGREILSRSIEGLDLFGQGWEDVGEFNAISFGGIPSFSMLDFLSGYRFTFAIENHSADNSLISERIWDALWADSVPIYMGNKCIDKFVPPECFVDARKFSSMAELVDWVIACDEPTWENLRQAGNQFRESQAIQKYSPEVVGRAIFECLCSVFAEGVGN